MVQYFIARKCTDSNIFLKSDFFLQPFEGEDFTRTTFPLNHSFTSNEFSFQYTAHLLQYQGVIRILISRSDTVIKINHSTGGTPKRSHADAEIREDRTRSDDIQCRVHVQR